MKSFLLTMAMCLLGIMPMFASAKDGEASLTAGYSTTVTIGSAYQRTLSKATGVNYKWTSSNTSLFTISTNNKNQCTIKGVAAGTGKLYYYCSYYYDGYYRTMDFYYDITVKAATVSVTSVTLSQTTINLRTGETFQLTATVYPTNATNKNVNWSTSKASVATVNSGGLITAQGAGTATISCYAADGSGCNKTCTVTVSDPTPTAIEGVCEDSDSGFSIEGNTIVFTKTQNVQVYNMNGILEYRGVTQRIDNLSKGIHIIRWGNQTKKVVI